MVKCRLFLYIEASEINATDENSKALTLNNASQLTVSHTKKPVKAL